MIWGGEVFGNIKYRIGIPKLYVKFWWPIGHCFWPWKPDFFGLQNPTFLAKIHIFIPKCTEGEGGSTGWGIIPEKFFF